MARKITVRFNGKIIGTRTTDRLYTHALVLIDFDPEVFRARDAADWLKFGKTNAKEGHRHAVEAKEPNYRYASVVSNEERARYALVAARSVEQHVAAEHAARLQRLEAHIDRLISAGTQVLSYHQGRDRAFKAQAAASKAHPAYLVLVEPTYAA
jgi:hypothetical protein